MGFVGFASFGVGSGHWSQDGATTIVGDPARIVGRWVRWQGGRVSETAVARGEQAVIIKRDSP